MDKALPVETTKLSECVGFVRKHLGEHWVVGAPLGLGKPNHVINALYEAAKSDASIRLDLFTALSLNPPKPAKGLKQRFLDPFVKKQFGDYPRLAYLADLDRGTVPSNITLSEFYFRSGSRLGDLHAQRHYVSSNYTHVGRDMIAKGINLLVQMVAVDPDRPGYCSLSCNPDVTLELFHRLPRDRLLRIAQANPDLPYMGGDAEIPLSEFDLLLQDHPQRLFAVPRMPVSDPDFLIGLFTSQLVRDGGTLQLGIGSLGDAVSYLIGMRQQNNEQYRQMCSDAEVLTRIRPGMVDQWGGASQFDTGLCAASEMFMDGFLHLYEAGVLKRKVYDHAGLQALINRSLISETLSPDTLEVMWQHGALPRQLDPASISTFKRLGIFTAEIKNDGDALVVNGRERLPNELSDTGVRSELARLALGRSLSSGAVLHAAFFLGSQWMYDTLNALDDEQRALFKMTSVGRVNQLLGGEELDRAQRLEARFINTTMKMTLLGAAVSDQLADGQVVSGVGGQYNFVSMAHELARGRSVLMLRSWRSEGKRAVSNLVWEYPHSTIPRHLRDVVVTEYGVADLRSANDEQVIQRLLCITDSRWQESLRQRAVHSGKLDPAWNIPGHALHNTPDWVRRTAAAWRARRWIDDYPFGSDFSPEEEVLARALAYLANLGESRTGRLKLFLMAAGPMGNSSPEIRPALERMKLLNPIGLREKLDRRILCVGIKSTSRHSSQ